MLGHDFTTHIYHCSLSLWAYEIKVYLRLHSECFRAWFFRLLYTHYYLYYNHCLLVCKHNKKNGNIKIEIKKKNITHIYVLIRSTAGDFIILTPAIS